MTNQASGPSFDVDAIGVRVRLTFPADYATDDVEQIRRSWSSALVPPDDETAPDEEILITPHDDLAAVAESLTTRVTLAALRHRSGHLAMFHACGVADAEGRVAAFVGPSGRGKTTLSRALGRHYGYVSDETIAVSAELAVLPYRKPLSVVREGAPKAQLAPAEVGLRPLPAPPLRLAALVLLAREPGQDGPHVEPVAFSEAIVDLAPQMSYFVELPRPLQTLAALADRVGGVVRLTYSDASTVRLVVPDLLARAAVPQSWEPSGIVAEPRDVDLSEVRDAIRCGAQVLVLAQRTVHVLDGIAPVVWDSLRSGLDLDGAVDAVVARFGRPDEGDPRELVIDVLDELAAAGILRRRDGAVSGEARQ